MQKRKKSKRNGEGLLEAVMGVNFPHDEEAIEELKLLSSRAKAYIEHYLGSSLCAVQLAAMNGRPDHVLRAVEHIRGDFIAFGCFGGAEAEARKSAARAGEIKRKAGKIGRGDTSR